jgi:hypothetical protein
LFRRAFFEKTEKNFYQKKKIYNFFLSGQKILKNGKAILF